MPEPNWDHSLEETVFGRILLRTKERIQALGLISIEPDHIQVRKLAWVDEVELAPPYIIVSPRAEITNWPDGTNEQDETQYAVLISMVLANSRDLTTKGMGLQLSWREAIRRSFQNKSIVSWPEMVLPSNCFFIQSYVESGDQFIEPAKRMQYDAQYWLVRFRVREPRT